ncbi:hypothetical protein RFN25_13010 [Mesorhizobium abyssinicae]|uniref:hypothetical protein n=1 Tax=Mesorhizobium abyssinicae TaxID=1209958 RepID=UPI002A23C2F9|nr:hypothetical protein [Mesorhizobium abyssinicae]MDX8434349.1 hypothetical protein [Mesorhizobium abyssinicae]
MVCAAQKTEPFKIGQQDKPGRNREIDVAMLARRSAKEAGILEDQARELIDLI